MPLMKRTPAHYLDEARRAQASADDHQSKAQAALDEARQIDADAVDTIVNDPAQAERVTREVSTKERIAAAHTKKAQDEQGRRDGLIRDALAAEAVRLDTRAEKATRAAARHQDAVDELLSRLEELDGVSYQVAPVQDRHGAGSHYPETRGEEIVSEVEGNRVQASLIRYYLEHGNIPETAKGLDRVDNVSWWSGKYINQARDFFIAPMLAAQQADTILDYTPED